MTTTRKRKKMLEDMLSRMSLSGLATVLSD